VEFSVPGVCHLGPSTAYLNYEVILNRKMDEKKKFELLENSETPKKIRRKQKQD
jgi:hypothetical protein